MKIRKRVYVTIILILAIGLMWFQKIKFRNIQYNHQMVLTVIVPPQEMVINDNKVIEQIVTEINESRKTLRGLYLQNGGWTLRIVLNDGRHYLISENTLIYNNLIYHVEGSLLSQVLELIDVEIE